MHLSNSLTLTANKKKLLSPLQSEDIWRHFELCIGKLNLFSCDPPQTTITWILLCLQWSSVKWLIWIIMDSKSRCLWPFSEHCFNATYFNIPVAEVSCVCSDEAWCPWATIDVDPIILPHGKSLPVCEMGTFKFSLESPSSVSTPHCPKLETYGICEAMCFARAYRWLQ